MSRDRANEKVQVNKIIEYEKKKKKKRWLVVLPTRMCFKVLANPKFEAIEYLFPPPKKKKL